MMTEDDIKTNNEESLAKSGGKSNQKGKVSRVKGSGKGKGGGKGKSKGKDQGKGQFSQETCPVWKGNAEKASQKAERLEAPKERVAFSDWKQSYKLVQELDLRARVPLLNMFDVEPKIYLYMFSKKGVARCPHGALKWPVQFLLSNFHRKHIFVTHNRCSSMDESGAAVQGLVSRVKWSCALRGVASYQLWRLLGKRRPRAKCYAAVNEKLEGENRETVNNIFLEGFRTRNAKKNRTRPIGVVKYAMKLIKGSDMATLPTDKDAGYAIMPKNMMDEMYNKNMKAPGLRQVPVQEHRGGGQHGRLLEDDDGLLQERAQRFVNEQDGQNHGSFMRTRKHETFGGEVEGAR